MLYLALLRPAGAGDSLLHLTRGILKHRQIEIHRRDDRCAARLPQLERRIGILRHKDLLDSEEVRRELRDDLGDARIDQLQTRRQLRGIGADTAAAQVSELAAGLTNHTVAGHARAGIDAQNYRHAASPVCRLNGNAITAFPQPRRRFRRYGRLPARRRSLPACRSGAAASAQFRHPVPLW